MTKKNNHTIFARQISEFFLDAIPHSLFTVLEINEYIQSRKINVLDFDTEYIKPDFQADSSALKSLLKRFFIESDNEIGITYFYEYQSWIAKYTHEYVIDQQERIDLYKAAYGTGLAFLDFLARCESDGIHQASVALYIQTAKQMTLDALNQLLDYDTGIGIDNTMLHKLRETLHKDKVQDFYGTFGVYSIFRNCSRFWYKLNESNMSHA